MTTFLFIIIAYLLGSIPTGLWVSRLFYQKDLRHLGSGNTGATNTFRVLGVKAGIIVITCDILKGVIAVGLPQWLQIPVHPLFIGLFACLGHAYPIFAEFRGGKAVATTAGILLGTHPLFTLMGLIFFLMSLYLTSIVSFSSMAVGIFLSLASLFMKDHIFILVLWGLCFFVIYRHLPNIERIKLGQENEVPFGLHLLQKRTK